MTGSAGAGDRGESGHDGEGADAPDEHGDHDRDLARETETGCDPGGEPCGAEGTGGLEEERAERLKKFLEGISPTDFGRLEF